MEATIRNEYLSVTAAAAGAELRSIRSADGTEYLWQGDPAYWADRSPTLFPYVARLTEGTYFLDGRKYAMRIHGFAPYSSFALTEKTEQAMAFTLEDSEATLAEYPRRFRFTITYRLKGRSLEILYRVENKDDRPMYFGLGGHPGFRVPNAKGKRFDAYRLRFAGVAEPRRIGFTEDCFLDGTDAPFPLEDGTALPLRHRLFDDDAIVLKDVPREVTLETEGDPHTVTVRFPRMPYLGLWHMPRTDAPYLCIEPWCSLPSTKNEIAVMERQADLIRLGPKETYDNLWSVTFGR